MCTAVLTWFVSMLMTTYKRYQYQRIILWISLWVRIEMLSTPALRFHITCRRYRIRSCFFLAYSIYYYTTIYVVLRTCESFPDHNYLETVQVVTGYTSTIVYQTQIPRQWCSHSPIARWNHRGRPTRGITHAHTHHKHQIYGYIPNMEWNCSTKVHTRINIDHSCMHVCIAQSMMPQIDSLSRIIHIAYAHSVHILSGAAIIHGQNESEVIARSISVDMTCDEQSYCNSKINTQWMVHWCYGNNSFTTPHQSAQIVEYSWVQCGMAHEWEIFSFRFSWNSMSHKLYTDYTTTSTDNLPFVPYPICVHNDFVSDFAMWMWATTATVSRWNDKQFLIIVKLRLTARYGCGFFLFARISV